VNAAIRPFKDVPNGLVPSCGEYGQVGWGFPILSSSLRTTMKAPLTTLLLISLFLLPSLGMAQATLTPRTAGTTPTKTVATPLVIGDLTMDGKTYRVLKCDYALTRTIDATGRPSSGVSGSVIQLAVEGTEDMSIWALMNDQFKKVNGTITFKKKDAATKMRDLNFTDAYVIAFAESYDAYSEKPLIVSFSLSARVISQGAAGHENAWPR